MAYDILWSDPTSNINQNKTEVNTNRDYIAKGNIVKFGTDRIKNFMYENNL